MFYINNGEVGGLWKDRRRDREGERRRGEEERTERLVLEIFKDVRQLLN